MLSVESALELILARAHALPAERVPVAEAAGHVLAEEARCDTDLPPWSNSAVDGYAVRAADLGGATEAAPARLPLAQEIAAGAPMPPPLAPGTAARILTGAPLPDGADAVVMQEDTSLERGSVGFRAAVEPGANVRYAGEDLHRGDVALTAGTALHAPQVALLASAGAAQPLVYRRPRVAVVTTGDELVPATVAPPPGKIRNSNGPALAAMVTEAGGVVALAIHLPDDLDATRAAFESLAAPEAGLDMVLCAGGVSVGDRDYVKPALEAVGSLELWRIAVKPGKPMAVGRLGGALFFGLPGNPASAWVTFELFVRPALRKMSGHTGTDLYRPKAAVRVTETAPHAPGRREYARAVVWQERGRLSARLAGAQGSSILRSMADANALLIIPEESPGLQPGDEAEAIILEG